MRIFSWKEKIKTLAKKLVIAALLTLLLIILGTFNGLGYHIYSIKEKSFTPYNQLGYAHVVLTCDIIYNPILYPYYWLVGRGHLAGDFHLIYIPEGYFPGEFGGPIWRTTQHRINSYLMTMLTWGITPNAITLFLIAIIIESLERSLFLSVLFGILGFLMGMLGILSGIIFGIIIVVLIKNNVPPFNFLKELWHSLWD